MVFSKPYHTMRTSDFGDDDKLDWVAISWRPDPVTMTVRPIVLGKGISKNNNTINIMLDSIPIVDADNICRIIIQTAHGIEIPEDFPEKWTVLAYRNDRMGNAKKTILGTAWIEDQEIVACLDSMPVPNQNVECWITLKPKIERINEQTNIGRVA